MNTLAERLTEVMRELKLSKSKDLADFCEVSEGLVTQWFSGQTKLGPKPLKAFARTNYSLDWLTDGKLPKFHHLHVDHILPADNADASIDNLISISEEENAAMSNQTFNSMGQKAYENQLELVYVSPSELRLLTMYRLSDQRGRQEIEHVASSTEKKSFLGVRNN